MPPLVEPVAAMVADTGVAAAFVTADGLTQQAANAIAENGAFEHVPGDAVAAVQMDAPHITTARQETDRCGNVTFWADNFGEGDQITIGEQVYRILDRIEDGGMATFRVSEE